MKKTKAKRLRRDEAADRLTDIIGGFLDRLPVDERRKRSASAHEFIRAKVTAFDRDARPTPLKLAYTPSIRLAARSAGK